MSHAANLKLRHGHANAHPSAKRQRQSLEDGKGLAKTNGIRIPFTNGDTGVSAHTTRDVKRRKREHDDEKTPAIVASTDAGLNTPNSQDVVEISSGDEQIYQDSTDDEEEDEQDEQRGDEKEDGDEDSSQIEEEDDQHPTSLKHSNTDSKQSQIGQAHDRDATGTMPEDEMSFGDLLVAKHGQDPISVSVAEAEKKKEESSTSLAAYRAPGSLTAPNAASLGTVLTQALKTNDVELLESCLHVGNLDSIRATIERLHSSLAASLLSKLAERMHKRPGRAGSLMVWVQWTVVAHGGYLASQPAAMQQLRTLYQVVKQRASGLQPLLALKGKLDMLEAQMQLRRRMQERSRELHGEEREPYIYVEGEESDDEAVNAQDQSTGLEAADSDDEDEDEADDEENEVDDEEDAGAPAALDVEEDDVEDSEEDEDEDEDEDGEDNLIDDEAEESSEDSLEEDNDGDDYEDEGEEVDDSISEEIEEEDEDEEAPRPKGSKQRK